MQPVASNGNFVYTFSGSGGAVASIEGYQLDISTGALTALSASPFKSIGTGTWGQFDQSGSNLFIFSNNNNTPALATLIVASGAGGLTEPGGPLPLDTSTTYFAVTDVP